MDSYYFNGFAICLGSSLESALLPPRWLAPASEFPAPACSKIDHSSIIFHHFGNIPTIPTASKQWFHPDLPGTVLPVVPRITSQHGTNQCSYGHGEHGEDDALKVGSLGLKIGHDWSMAFPCFSHGIYPPKKKCLKSFNHQNPAAIRMVLPSWSAI